MFEKWLALWPIGIHERVGLDLAGIGVASLQMLFYASLSFCCSRTLHGTQYTHHSLKYLLPQRRISYNDVFLLLSSTTL
jgi:hypothetical protein